MLQENNQSQQPMQQQTPETETPPQNQPEMPQEQPNTEGEKKPAQPKAPSIPTTQEERIWAAIGYVAFLGVVTLAMQPKSNFCKKHASQGLLIFVLWFIGLIVMVVPFIEIFGGIILLVASLLAILGIVRSIQSEELNLPVLSSMASKIPVDSIIGSVTGKPAPKPEEQQPSEQPGQPSESQQPAQPEQQPPAEGQQPEQPEEQKPEDPQNS